MIVVERIIAERRDFRIGNHRRRKRRDRRLRYGWGGCCKQ
jgi:hypothetical protein